MSAASLQLARLALAGLSARDRADLVQELRGAPAPVEPDRILRVSQAADRLGVTPRTIFTLMKQRILLRVKLPGRKRACGVRKSDLDALIDGGTK